MANLQPPIIDSHIHLFTAEHLPYLAWTSPTNPLHSEHSISEYLASIPETQRDSFKGFVFIETDRVHTEPSQAAITSNDEKALKTSWEWTIEEFNFVYKLSEQNELVRGIVPWAPMNLGVQALERFWSLLELEGESNKRRKEMLKGFRYLVQDKPKGTILKKEFVDSMEWVWRKGLAVEIGVDVRSGGIWQLEEAVLAIESIVKKDVPEKVGSFVINHLCKPPLNTSPADTPSSEIFKRWSGLLTRVASAHPSITMKLSGVFSELPHNSEFYPSILSKESIILDLVSPWVNEVFNIFGSYRVLWGSDWPVCKLGFAEIYADIDAGGAEGAWETWRRLTGVLMKRAGIMEKQSEMIWGGNTVRAYNLSVDRVD
ncbi:uncharacterized protein H6S33_006561 [Morchella sextelata]|uniref:uncharacterized protein n=1 Tax=Morchella sextelata TaxID=1174677 RepID=UPI001D04F688|nr:uncharacterized protein H6S33_006561 [Morchella sextelata]KAH0604893.1 hypothetical protein H6S33_006561 [Morchella sextelata]